MEDRKNRRLNAKKEWKQNKRNESFTKFWDKQPKIESEEGFKNRQTRRERAKKRCHRKYHFKKIKV